MSEPSWMWLAGAALANVVGFAWLALAMDGHWRQVHGGTRPAPGVRIMLRMLGTAGLLVSAGLCLVADVPSMAALVWVMLLAAAAPVVALALTWRPRLLRAVWPWGDRSPRGA
ncbi:DUF3325 domain-containing protein [Pseudorhodoferax sp.]|uniref:DUF3325 domain-containing protein n=1 Tax=Pseudorhodoferax sp. TaxID=1993553 RepID=UPI0039E2AC27